MDLNFSWDWFQPFCCNSEYFNTLINGISTKVFNIHNHFLSSEVQNRIEINFVEFSTKDGFEAEFDEFVYCILHNVDLKAFADVSTAGLKHKFIRWFILPNAITFPVSSFNLLSFVVMEETKRNQMIRFVTNFHLNHCGSSLITQNLTLLLDFDLNFNLGLFIDDSSLINAKMLRSWSTIRWDEKNRFVSINFHYLVA